MEPDAYSGREGMAALFEEASECVALGDIESLATMLLIRANRTYEKHEVPRVVAALMLKLGPTGAHVLRNLLSRAPGAIYPRAIMRTLWLAADGRSPLKSTLGITYPEIELDPETCAAARMIFDDFVVEAQSDGQLFGLLLALQQEDDRTSADSGVTALNRHVQEILRDSAIVLTTRLMDEYDDLIATDQPELEYQKFLEAHPVFLDPLAAEVFNRQRLGNELVTDFMVRRHDGRYLAVEIEKPQDRIFTLAGNFTAAFTHAIGQVLDFQGWVNGNVAYARSHLAGIENPAGLLIMGRRSDLDIEGGARLRRWCENSRAIEVKTYDDLARAARALHSSLRGKPAIGVVQGR